MKDSFKIFAQALFETMADGDVDLINAKYVPSDIDTEWIYQYRIVYPYPFVDDSRLIKDVYPNKWFDDYSLFEKRPTQSYNPLHNNRLSVDLLLKDFLVGDYCIKNVKNGIPYAVQYLIENKYDVDDNKSNYEVLEDLLYLRYGLKDYLLGTWERYLNSFVNKYNNTDYGPNFVEIKNVFDYVNSLPSDTPEEEKKQAMRDGRDVITELIDMIISDDFTPDMVNFANEQYELEVQALNKKYNYNQSISKLYDSRQEKKKYETEKNTGIYNVMYATGSLKRYETEAEYFNNLKETDPTTFKSLKDKYKYFNPAFHSMSPEGFNARLNFLHQCTRQGATLESSSWGDLKVANNLAFGRMPVCVLRIGDFINTKIIINSMTISYGPDGNMNWDLNPEGIGVQPMYAKINLGISILGGQSLEGPINRLQNAVTFDYYANTGVYDNRADMVHYQNGNPVYTHLFTPEFNDANSMNGLENQSKTSETGKK